MTDKNKISDFLSLSAALTGVPAARLAALENQMRQLVEGELEALLDEFRHARDDGNSDEQAAGVVLAGNHEDLARSILKLWLLGSWYPPGANFPETMTTDTFIGGLVWRIMQAHPTGYTDPTFAGNNRFGYWEQAPPPLAEFLGETDAETED